jgi:hypothetical protein
VEVHSLRVAIPEYLLACLGLISLALTVFLGAPVLFSSGECGRLGSLWTRPGLRLDERELHLQQKTFALTCRILIVSILLAGFLLTWIDLHHLLPDTTGGASALLPLAVLSFLGVAGIGLPSAILAWLEPDSSNTD